MRYLGKVVCESSYRGFESRPLRNDSTGSLLESLCCHMEKMDSKGERCEGHMLNVPNQRVRAGETYERSELVSDAESLFLQKLYTLSVFQSKYS